MSLAGAPLPPAVVLFLLTACGSPAVTPAAPDVAVERAATNPILTPASSPSIGLNLSGPAPLAVPTWVDHPLGRYCLYFAAHRGRSIRLAYADAPTGPWTVYEPAVVDVSETAFARSGPAPPPVLSGALYDHLASPDVVVDDAGRRIILRVHGWWTDGAPWPASRREYRRWRSEGGYGQYTQALVSTDGLHFEGTGGVTRASYVRTFPYDGRRYGIARLGRLLRGTTPEAPLDLGPDPFAGTPYAGRVRHAGPLVRGSDLLVFFSAIGDSPERILLTRIPLTGDWSTWRAGPAVEVLRPEAAYECAALPDAPSKEGEAPAAVKELRDPALLEEGGRTWLYYTVCGEGGIAVARLTVES